MAAVLTTVIPDGSLQRADPGPTCRQLGAWMDGSRLAHSAGGAAQRYFTLKSLYISSCSTLSYTLLFSRFMPACFDYRRLTGAGTIL
jgi:hypothetical protein